jgi:hypothetical protein
MRLVNPINFFRKYPYSIALYIIYILFFARIEWITLQYKAAVTMNHGARLMLGEGIMYGYIIITFIAGVFSLVTMASILAYKDHMRYYVCLLFAIIIPAIVLWNQ